MKIEFNSEFLNYENVKQDINYKIVSDVREIENKFNPDKQKLVIDLEDDKGKTYTANLNRTSQRNIVKVFGDETENWLDKSIKALVMPMLVSGETKKVVVYEPVE